MPASPEELNKLAQQFLHNAQPALAEHLAVTEELDDLRKLFTELPPIVGIDVEHSMNCGYNIRKKQTTGCHVAPRNPEKILTIMDLPDEYGVFGALVKDLSHESGKYSTFFPIQWTEKQIINALKEALKNIYTIKRGNNSFTIRGQSLSGVKIEFYLTCDGTISSFFPILKR